MERKRIILMTRTLGNGGAERVVSVLGNEFNQKYKLFLVLFDASKNDYTSSGDLIDLKSNNKKKNFVTRFYTVFDRVKKVKLIKREQNIETSISFLEGPNIVNLMTPKNNKIILSIRNYKSEQNKGLLGLLSTLSIKIFYNRANIIVVPSKLMYLDLIENFHIKKNKVKVIYNPYEIKKISVKSLENLDSKILEIIQDNKVLINVGSLSTQKGQEYLVRIFKKVKAEINNIKLLIIGKGHLEGKLKYLVKEEGLEEDVIFFGFQDNPFKFISHADLFVFPSLFEGFPNALVEAMACKKAVIAADCKSGPREILSPDSDIKKITDKIIYAEYGVLAPVFRPGVDSNLEINNKILEWTEGIVELLNNDKKRKEYEELSFVRALDFDVKKIIKNWEEII